MSDTITLKLSPIHGIIAALVFFAGGGGVFAAMRRNRRRATADADPEAVELVVTGAADGSVTLDDNDATDASY